MNKENKLGMGLGALLSTTGNNTDNKGIQKVNISQIIPNPSQPRKNFKDEDLRELSSSIKNQGLIQPIIIKPIKDGQYQIIAGERRWRACQVNGMHEVECVIKNLDDTNFLNSCKSSKSSNLAAKVFGCQCQILAAKYEGERRQEETSRPAIIVEQGEPSRMVCLAYHNSRTACQERLLRKRTFGKVQKERYW